MDLKELLKKFYDAGIMAEATLEEKYSFEQTLADNSEALQLQQTGVMQRYFHPFVGAGTLIKETEKSLVIKLDFNGKEYFAPKHEFTELL